MISVGQPATWFIAESPANPRFAFSSLGGRYVLLGFLPSDPDRSRAMLDRLERHRALFNVLDRIAFAVTADAATYGAARDKPGLQWFFDPRQAISRAFGALDEQGADRGRYVLVDPSLRILAWADGEAAADRLFATIAALPDPDHHAGVELNAPVLIVPRVFEPALCQLLVGLFEAQGGAPSGVMVEREGRTVPLMSDFKSRRDLIIEDEALRAQLRRRIESRLLPEIAKAFQARPTRLERYLVACYDAAESGHFNPHRDNTTKGTAHREFACSINLNAEAFEGGDLRFPEFGRRTYRPPTGGAVVFSCSLLHEATPVTRGRRYAFLPFFYGEANQKLREENLAHLDLTAIARA